MDVKRYPRFRRPGHAVTGDRRAVHLQRTNPLGYDYFHAIVDDHSRLIYGELLADEKAGTVVAFVERGLAWFADHGIVARRLMTDGAMTYRRNRALRELLHQREIRHIITPPYTPRWNGKVERFHQTMEREWAKGLRYRNSTARNRALPHWRATTTSAGPTAHSATDHRSAALTTSPGRTTRRSRSQRLVRQGARCSSHTGMSARLGGALASSRERRSLRSSEFNARFRAQLVAAGSAVCGSALAVFRVVGYGGRPVIGP